MGAVHFAWDYDLNMDSYHVALFVALALISQCQQLSANDCKRRTTFVQIRIPQRTNVAIKYPKEINSVQYVPFPYLSSGSHCIKCEEATCNKCSNIKPPTYSMTHARKTNIVIDIKGTRQLNESTAANAPKNSSGTVDGTIVGIYDRTSATSKSGATATTNNKGKSSAATASGTSSSQIDTIAALNEVVINKDTGEKSNVEDIYAASEDGSTADANSTSGGEPDKNETSSESDSEKSDKSSDKKSDGGELDTDSSDKATKSFEEKKTGDDSSTKPADLSSDAEKSLPADTSGKDDKGDAPPEVKDSSDKDTKVESADAESDKATKPSDEKKTGDDSSGKSADSSSDDAKSLPADISGKDDKGDAPPEVKDTSDIDKKVEFADAESHDHDTISDADPSLDKPSSSATAKATISDADSSLDKPTSSATATSS